MTVTHDCQLVVDAHVTQTTAFCWHSNTHRSEAQQFWRQDLCRHRTTSLEQSAAQSLTMWGPVQAVRLLKTFLFG